MPMPMGLVRKIKLNNILLENVGAQEKKIQAKTVFQLGALQYFQVSPLENE